jgi:hypothetical protein
MQPILEQGQPIASLKDTKGPPLGPATSEAKALHLEMVPMMEKMRLLLPLATKDERLATKG